MDRPNVTSVTTLSGSSFYQKIMKKYQAGKWKNLRFPIMIFYDNRGHFHARKISKNILLKPHLNNQNIVSFLNMKIILSMKGISPWLNTGQILRSEGKQKKTQSVNRTSADKFLKSLVSRAENKAIETNKILRPLFLATHNAFYQQKIHIISSDSKMMNNQQLNYENNIRIVDSQISRMERNYRSIITARNSTPSYKEKMQKYQSSLGHKLPSIFLRDNSLFNSTILKVNKLFFKEIDRGSTNNPLIKKYYYDPENGSSSFVQRRYPYTKDTGDLHFLNTLHIEKEVEQIKKIVAETRELALEKPAPSIGEADIKRYFDINRISDQVYKNIERTIRMERERRGM